MLQGILPKLRKGVRQQLKFDGVNGGPKDLMRVMEGKLVVFK